MMPSHMYTRTCTNIDDGVRMREHHFIPTRLSDASPFKKCRHAATASGHQAHSPSHTLCCCCNYLLHLSIATRCNSLLLTPTAMKCCTSLMRCYNYLLLLPTAAQNCCALLRATALCCCVLLLRSVVLHVIAMYTTPSQPHFHNASGTTETIS